MEDAPPVAVTVVLANAAILGAARIWVVPVDDSRYFREYLVLRTHQMWVECFGRPRGR